MPLIEPVACCRKFNALNRTAQWFYLQLKLHLDPAGRHDAHPGILKSTLFPLRNDVRDTDISRWLLECEHAGLLRCYADLKGRSVVEVFDARQTRMKSIKSDFDPPEGQMPLFNGLHPPKGSERKGSEGKRSRDNASDKPFQEAGIPTWNEVKDYAEMHAIDETSAKSFFNHHEDNGLWINQFGRLIPWSKKIITWAANDRQPNSKNAHHCPSSARNTGLTQTAESKAGDVLAVLASRTKKT